MNDIFKRSFDLAMLDLYKRAYSEVGYKATRILQMLDKHKGVTTAKILINSPTVSEGYTALYDLGRIDLTVEAVIFDNPE